jgi:hypothetical protein
MNKYNVISYLPMIEESSKFSVYELWVMGDDKPFYVGKGLNGRPYDHLYLAKNGDKTLKSNKIRKAWKMNLPIIIKHIFYTDIEQEAFNEEIRLIALYGRRDKGNGVLVNFTDGGEGQSGPSNETRRKISESSKKHVWTEESRRKLSESKIGIELSEEHRQKIGDANRGKKKPIFSEEHRQNLSNSHLGYVPSEETRQKLREANTGRVMSEEQRIKLIGNKFALGNKSGRGKIISNETRIKISNSLTGRSLSVEHRQKISEGRIGIIVSEETRLKISKAHLGKVKSDDHRQKISIAKKGKKQPPRSEKHCQNLSKSIKRASAIRSQTKNNLTTLNKILGLD